MLLDFNPINQLGEFTEQYAQDKRLRLFDILMPQSAGALAKHIHEDLTFTNAYFDDGQFKTINTEALQNLSVEEQQALTKKLYKQAAQGQGFFYGKSQVVETPSDSSLSQQAYRWLNSAETLEGIRKMTGHTDINAANAQATRFYPGHFLTRHNDINSSENRRVAYVLNLSPKWHPDWGGLLQFYHQNGNPKDTWVPIFNSLALFDVEHPHGVSYVAPFAKNPRLAITGWFTAT